MNYARGHRGTPAGPRLVKWVGGALWGAALVVPDDDWADRELRSRRIDPDGLEAQSLIACRRLWTGSEAARDVETRLARVLEAVTYVRDLEPGQVTRRGKESVRDADAEQVVFDTLRANRQRFDRMIDELEDLVDTCCLQDHFARSHKRAGGAFGGGGRPIVSGWEAVFAMIDAGGSESRERWTDEALAALFHLRGGLEGSKGNLVKRIAIARARFRVKP